MPNPDSYITLSPSVAFNRWIVVVMKDNHGDYIQTRVSEAMKRGQAEALAKSWAAAMRLEIR